MSTDPDSVFHPDAPGNALKPETAPIGDEPLIQKQVNSAIGTELESYLRERDIDTLVVTGLTTDH